MKSFKQHINEAFDKPARWKWVSKSDLGWEAQFKSGNQKYIVLFYKIDIGSTERWEVEFNKYAEATDSTHSSLEVITTVMDTIRAFIKEKDPDKLTFMASKPEGDYEDIDRGRLYTKLVKKYVTRDYKVDIEDKRNNINFEIKKK